MVSSKKDQSSSFSNSIRKIVKSLVPKSFSNYNKCVKNHCSKERRSYNENKDKIDDGMKQCFMKNGNNKKSLRKCLLSVRKSLPEVKKLSQCAKKHCKSERKKLMKDVKKHSKIIHTKLKSKSKSKSKKISRK